MIARVTREVAAFLTLNFLPRQNSTRCRSKITAA